MIQDSLVDIDAEGITILQKEYHKKYGYLVDLDRWRVYYAGAKAAFNLLQIRTQSNLQSKGASKEQLYFNTLTEGQRIKYFEDVEELKNKLYDRRKRIKNRELD